MFHSNNSREGLKMFKTVNDGKLPERATTYSAGFDVYTNQRCSLIPGETVLIPLGICLDSESEIFEYIKQLQYGLESFYIELHPRSSLRAKGLNGGVGIIDIDYRDEIKMVVTNNSNNVHTIAMGDKIGQLILKRHEGWLLPPEYTKNVVRNGGFGSTNEK